MPRSKRLPMRRYPAAAPSDPRQAGLRAFHANRFSEAILIWSRLAESDPQVRGALAEALFRRAIGGPASDTALADLRRAIELEPDDMRLRYHLGRYLHLRGDRAAAFDQPADALLLR